MVAAALVALSLLLITVYFRESEDGGLHGFQDAGATVLRPFEVAAERVSRPFRDVYGYFADLARAKGEVKRLRGELTLLRQQAIQNAAAVQEASTLKSLLKFKGPPSYPADYRPVRTAVVATPPNKFDQQIVVAAGTANGIRVDDAVVNGQGLVGSVTRIASRSALVTLLTDRTSAVSAAVLRGGAGAFGIIQAGGGRRTLNLDRVTKDEVVRRGDAVVTAGTKVGREPSLYPGGIPIGVVASVGQTDTDLFKRIQVRPFVDFSSLRAVVVIVPKSPGDRR